MNRAGNAKRDWKVTEKCIHCGLPIAKWDTGLWVHLRMGQIECHISDPDGNKATPMSEEDRIIGEFYKMVSLNTRPGSSFPNDVKAERVPRGYKITEKDTGLVWMFDGFSKTWYKVDV